MTKWMTSHTVAIVGMAIRRSDCSSSGLGAAANSARKPSRVSHF